MAKPLDSLDYIAQPKKHAAQPICVLFGDEGFLQLLALQAMRAQVLGGGDGDFSQSVLNGRDAELRALMDELSTLSLFGGGRRLVVVEEADEFVSRYRKELEGYAGRPKKNSVLVLLVKTWPATTRLYKLLAESGLQVECRFPPPARLIKWLIQWAQKRHGAKLDAAAAEALIELVEPELGLFDQELAKLAAMAGEGGTITADLVNEAVGSWRAKTTWEMLDAAVAGNAPEALDQLDRLLLSGEVPIALLGQISATLRKLAAATRLIEQAEQAGRRITLRQALEEVGFKSFVLSKAESQMRQLGRARGAQLYDWLMEADLALKGSSSSPPRARLVLEQLIARFSTANAPKSGPRPASAIAGGRR